MIHIAKKGKHYWVRTPAKNGEKLSTSETLATKQSAWKNIKAQLKAFNSFGVVVKDLETGLEYWCSYDNKKWRKQLIVGGLKKGERYPPPIPEL